MVGLITMIIGVLGGRGATVSYQCLEHGTQNFWLMALTFIVGFMLVVELSGIIWLAIEYGAIKNDSVTQKSDSLAKQFEDSLKDKLEKQDEAWWDWQTNNRCCGYDNNTIPAKLATGKYCTDDPDTSAVSCKDKLWDDVDEKLWYIILFGITFLTTQISICVSSMCLACIIKAQEPIYSE